MVGGGLELEATNKVSGMNHHQSFRLWWFFSICEILYIYALLLVLLLKGNMNQR